MGELRSGAGGPCSGNDDSHHVAHLECKDRSPKPAPAGHATILDGMVDACITGTSVFPAKIRLMDPPGDPDRSRMCRSVSSPAPILFWLAVRLVHQFDSAQTRYRRKQREPIFHSLGGGVYPVDACVAVALVGDPQVALAGMVWATFLSFPAADGVGLAGHTGFGIPMVLSVCVADRCLRSQPGVAGSRQTTLGRVRVYSSSSGHRVLAAACQLELQRVDLEPDVRLLRICDIPKRPD